MHVYARASLYSSPASLYEQSSSMLAETRSQCHAARREGGRGYARMSVSRTRITHTDDTDHRQTHCIGRRAVIYMYLRHRLRLNTSSAYRQSLASIAPTYLISDIHLVSEHGRRLLRSSTDRTLTVPRTHNRFGNRSFAVAGHRLWNSLPLSL